MKVLRHPLAPDRGDAGQDINFIQDISLIHFLQPQVESFRIKDQVGLEELCSGIDFLFLPECLETGFGGKG